MKKKVIYDLGANNGDDIPYYLLKSDFVVAVEANPILCELISAKYCTEVQEGRLAVENCVVTAQAGAGSIEFFVHKSDHVLSQLPPPPPNQALHFDKVVLPAKSVSEIIKTHGDPYYIKIDIEHYDAQILRALFSAGIYPPFISAESHSIEIFSLLVAQGRYNAFKLVDGHSIPQVYSRHLVTCDTQGKKIKHAFPYHSAGPFGDDVNGPWVTADAFLGILALEGLGWKDIHATNQEFAAPVSILRPRDYLLPYLLRVTKTKGRSMVTKVRRALGLGRR